MRVTLIDAHHHLWDLKNSYPWLNDANDPHFFLGPYDDLKKNYLWPDYEKDTSDHQVLATDRKSTRLNSSHSQQSRMPSSA